MRSIIYYFSGTGNSYYIAKSLSEILSAKISNINEMPLTAKQFDRIGIVCPVYATHAPKVVTQYINETEFSDRTHIFLIITYVASYGYAAREVYDAVNKNSILLFQNFKIRMPGNSILEYGAFPNYIQRKLLIRAGRKVIKIADFIDKRLKTDIIKPNLLARMFIRNGQKMIKNFNNKGVLFYSNEKCKKCKTCVELCPTKNITWVNEQPKWNNHCQQCMACIQWCPNNAICHPSLKEGRRKYRNPYVTVDMLIRNEKMRN